MDKKLHKFFFFVLVLSVLRKFSFSMSIGDNSLSKDGDVIFGALLPIYRKDEKEDCKLFNKDAILWIKAFRLALHELESTKNPVFQNTTFGYRIQDTCRKSALDQALDLVRSSRVPDPSQKKIVAILSSHYDQDSSTLLNLFKIPNMIFADFDVGEFGSFPMEHNYNFEALKLSFYRAKALVDLMKHFHWDSVFVVLEDRYRKEFHIFREIAETENVCIAGTAEGYKGLVSKITRSLEIRTVLLFTDGMDMLDIIKAMKNVRPSHYTWIDVTGSARDMTSEFVMTGEVILCLSPEFKFLSDLRKYVFPECRSENGSNEKDEIWCKIEESSYSVLQEIDQSLASMKGISYSSSIVHRRTREVQGMLNGVLTIGKALARHMKASCWDKTKVECLDSLTCTHIANELKVLTRKHFLDKTTHQKPFLKENMFSLLNIHGNASRPREVGTWEKTWFINNAGIRWPGKAPDIPVSTCGPTCPAGYVQVAEEGRKCCWSCQACNYNQFITDNYTCADCVRGYWPSKDHRTCEFNIKITLVSCIVAISSVSAVLYSLVL